jgi:hypothetical protein
LDGLCFIRSARDGQRRLDRAFRYAVVQHNRCFLTTMGQASFFSFPLEMRLALLFCCLSVQRKSAVRSPAISYESQRV